MNQISEQRLKVLFPLGLCCFLFTSCGGTDFSSSENRMTETHSVQQGCLAGESCSTGNSTASKSKGTDSINTAQRLPEVTQAVDPSKGDCQGEGCSAASTASDALSQKNQEISGIADSDPGAANSSLGQQEEVAVVQNGSTQSEASADEGINSGLSSAFSGGCIGDDQKISFDQKVDGAYHKAGEGIDGQYSPSTEVIVSASSRDGKTSAEPIILDSVRPGSGYEDFKTPGTKARMELGNILVISQNNLDADGDGYIDVPAPKAGGGMITFAFESPARLKSLVLLDNDEGLATVLLTKRDGTKKALTAAASADNEILKVTNDSNELYTKAEVLFHGTLGIDNIVICR